MENMITATVLNDFVFCPASIYFHKLYASSDIFIYQNTDQLNGTNAHVAIDFNKYSTSKEVITSLDVYSEKYNIIGKIDIYYLNKGLLVERKKKIRKVYDGYVFQLYAQYFALIEMGYKVEKIQLYSMDDKKKYEIDLPDDNEIMYKKFVRTIDEIMNFSMDNFVQNNKEKCMKCIYEAACDRSLCEDD